MDCTNTTNETRSTKWQDDTMRGATGVIVFMSILTCLGIVGNSHVIYIYVFKSTPSKKRLYFIWLGIVDMLTCTIAIPCQIYMFVNMATYENNILCKFSQFVSCWWTCNSSSSLLIIAVDRYKLICRPTMRQMSIFEVKIACLIVSIASAVGTSPVLFVYGTQTICNNELAIIGMRCMCRKDLNTICGVVQAFLFVLAICVITSICVIYAVIGKQLRTWKRIHQKKKYKEIVKRGSTKQPKKIEETTLSSDPCRLQMQNEIESDMTTSNETDKSLKEIDRNKTRRITRLFLVITVVMVLSWIPYFILSISNILITDLESSLSMTEAVFYLICLRSPFLNNVVNPIVYGLMDPFFRYHLRRLYTFCRRHTMH